MSESLQNFLGKYSTSNTRVIDQTDDILRTEEIEEPDDAGDANAFLSKYSVSKRKEMEEAETAVDMGAKLDRKSVV